MKSQIVAHHVAAVYPANRLLKVSVLQHDAPEKNSTRGA